MNPDESAREGEGADLSTRFIVYRDSFIVVLPEFPIKSADQSEAFC